jgi:hypothetical protein
MTEPPYFCNAPTMNQFLLGLLPTSEWAHTIRSGPNHLWYSTTSRDSNPGRSKRFLSLANVQAGSWAHPVSNSMGNGIIFPAAKRPGRKDNSTLSRAEVENERDYTSTPLVCFHGRERNNFNFYVGPLRQFHPLV